MSGFRVDLSAFLRTWSKIQQQAPERIVLGVAKTAKRGRDAVRHRTRQVFGLHSEYIPNAIRSMPDPRRAKAIAAATRALTGRHRDFTAYVYLRGSSSPQKSMDFMVVHETGGTRRSVKGGSLAVPGIDLYSYYFKTGRGRTKKGWKPAKLLEHYNRVGAAKKGSKKQMPTRGKPKAFILESTRGSGRSIVRRISRKSRDLEFLYRFKESVQIDRRWNFVKTVHSTTKRYLTEDIIKELNKP